jgi:hypothetical protein
LPYYECMRFFTFGNYNDTTDVLEWKGANLGAAEGYIERRVTLQVDVAARTEVLDRIDRRGMNERAPHRIPTSRSSQCRHTRMPVVCRHTLSVFLKRRVTFRRREWRDRGKKFVCFIITPCYRLRSLSMTLRPIPQIMSWYCGAIPRWCNALSERRVKWLAQRRPEKMLPKWGSATEDTIPATKKRNIAPETHKRAVAAGRIACVTCTDATAP